MPVTSVNISLLQEAYDMVLAQWPDVIEPGQKSFHVNGHCNMRLLNEIHDPISAWVNTTTFTSEIDEIISSVEHYIFATIHDALKNLTRLSKADLDFDVFTSRFDSHPNFQVVRTE